MTGSNCSVSPYTVFQRNFLILKRSGAEINTVSGIESAILSNKAQQLHNIVYSAKIATQSINYIQAQVVMDRTSNLCRELQALKGEAPCRTTKAGQN